MGTVRIFPRKARFERIPREAEKWTTINVLCTEDWEFVYDVYELNLACPFIWSLYADDHV